MKRIILIISLLLLTSLVLVGQGRHRMGPPPHAGGRLAQLEKIKLIEFLDMDEETTLKFFARREAFHENRKEIFNKRAELLDELREMVIDDEDNSNYQALINQIYEYEEKLFTQRKEFFDSLSDILTQKQIASLIIFEDRFRREIRDILLDRPR